MKKHRKTIILSLMILVILFFGYFAFGLLIEDYCGKKAHNIVGKNWTTLYKPTTEEMKYAKGLTQISAGYREEIKCYKNFNVIDVLSQKY